MRTSLATLERQTAALQRQIRDIVHDDDADEVVPPKRSALDIAAELGISLDPWQIEALTTQRHDVLLCVTRQGGKGMVASLLAIAKMVNDPGSTTVIVARADRQAKRLLRRIKRLYLQLADVPPLITDSAVTIELRSGSEVLALPGSEETIRGIEAVDLLIVDEAALVPDDLFYAVHPMLATTDGRCVAMSTARGKRGWFWREWESTDAEWHRAKITAPEIPRIKPEWLERTRRRIGEFMYRQEFLCEFMEDENSLFLFDDIAAALRADVAPLYTERVFG